MKKYESPTINDLLEIVGKNYDANAKKSIANAYDFAASAHTGKYRASGLPLISHSLAIACFLAERSLSTNVVMAGLLHNMHLNPNITSEHMREVFGDEVAILVERLGKLDKTQYRGSDRFLENNRKMLIALAEDMRTVFIKFTDRLHNLQTLNSLSRDLQYQIAKEAMEIYAPIAERLGMNEMKAELQDSAFPYLDPESYKKTLSIYKSVITHKKHVVLKAQKRSVAEAKSAGIKILDTFGREKSLYSLYRKLQRYDWDISKIHDLVAVRLVVESKIECYRMLGILHAAWSPLPSRIKDYIASPKSNNYQSLHTTVFFENGEIVEFQIRTPEMHETAEYGIAAHWRYKEVGKIFAKNIKWVDNLIPIQKQIAATHEAFLKKLENLKFDIFKDRIFVFTPNGDIIDIPKGATAIDFAYAIHTEIGNHLAGVEVNGKQTDPETALSTGNMCRIITSKEFTPTNEWLDIAKTYHARKHIREALQMKNKTYAGSDN